MQLYLIVFNCIQPFGAGDFPVLGAGGGKAGANLSPSASPYQQPGVPPARPNPNQRASHKDADNFHGPKDFPGTGNKMGYEPHAPVTGTGRDQEIGWDDEWFPQPRSATYTTQPIYLCI